MGRRKPKVFSVLIIADGAGLAASVVSGVSAEEAKVKLAGLLPGDRAYVFAGPQVQWGQSIELYADDAPAQKTGRPKGSKNKPKPAAPVEPKNGAAKDEVRT